MRGFFFEASMAENTKIEWTDHTFNPWIGCTKVGPGCDHCYAENLMDKRMGVAVWGPGNERVRTKPANWKIPLRWNAQADAFMAQHGRRQRVFCASLADVFDNAVDPQWRADLFELIAATPNLDWLLLTKRVGNVGNMLPVPFDFDKHFPNVWIGATIVNQAEADRDIPKLLAVPARVRFLSMEPLLGPVTLREVHSDMCEIDALTGDHGVLRPLRGRSEAKVHWVICGGESGPGARPMHPDWARSLRDQCEAAGVPFLFKQWGEWGEPDSIERTGIAHHGWFEQDRRDGGVPRHEWPGPMQNSVELASLRPEVFRVGKKAAGRLLDGRTWDGFPPP